MATRLLLAVGAVVLGLAVGGLVVALSAWVR
jgi:hypothetical protein